MVQRARSYEKIVNICNYPGVAEALGRSFFLVWYDKRTGAIIRVPESLKNEYAWMQGWNWQALIKFMQDPLDPGKFTRPVPTPFVPQWQEYFQELTSRIESLMMDIAYERNIMIKEGKSQFLQPWHEFVEYSSWQLHNPNRANLPKELARLFMEQGNTAAFQNMNVEIFFKELTEDIYSKPIPVAYEEIHEMMVTNEILQAEMAGTIGKFKKTIQDISIMAIAYNAERQAASRNALSSIIDDIEKIIDIEVRENRKLPPGIKAHFGMLLEKGDDITLSDVNRFIDQYPGLIEDEVRQAVGDIEGKVPIKTGTMDDTAFVKLEPVDSRQKVSAFQEDMRRDEAIKGPIGISAMKGQGFLRNMGVSESAMRRMGMHADEYETPYWKKTQAEKDYDDLFAPEVHDMRKRTMIEERKKKDLKASITPGAIKQRTKLPAMDKIAISIDKNYTFKRGPTSVKVSVKGIGIGGVMGDAFIKKMYANLGGDKNALNKMKETIVAGIKKALQEAINAMLPIWQEQLGKELAKEGVTNITVNKPKINIKSTKESVEANIEFTWTKPSSGDTVRIKPIGGLPQQERGRKTGKEALRILSGLAKKNVVTPPTTQMDKVMRKSSASVAIGGVSQVTGEEAKSLIEDAAVMGDNIVDNLASNLQAQPGDVIGVSLREGEPAITVIKGGSVTKPGVIKKLIPGKIVTIQKIGVPRLEITEPMEPVTDSFRSLMQGIQRGYGGNIFEQLAKFLWQFDVPLPDMRRVSSMEEMTKKVADASQLKNRVDTEINNEVARIRTGDEEAVVKNVIRRVIEETTIIIGKRVTESEGEIATIWNRSVV